MTADYVHGYSRREHDRLVDQATTLTTSATSITGFAVGGLAMIGLKWISQRASRSCARSSS